MNQPVLMHPPPNPSSDLGSYASSSLDANGSFLHAGYGLAHHEQVVPSLNGACPAAIGMTALAFPGQQYDPTNASNGLEWDASASQLPASTRYFSLDSTLHLKLQSLPMLDNLATQVIASFTRSSFPEIVNFVTRPESDKGQAYATVKALFEDTKRIYSRDHAFLNHSLLGLHDVQQQDTIRKANLATFMSSIFRNSNDVNLYYLHTNFLDTFVPFGSRMLKWHAAVFLELKTQAYISAVFNGGMSRESTIQDLFPPDMDSRLLARRPDAKQLLPSEQEFITRMNTRRYYLLAENSSPQALALLARKYDWTDFLKELSSNISKNLDSSNSYVPRPAQASYSDTTTYKELQMPSDYSTRRPLRTEMLPPTHTPSRNASIETQEPIRTTALTTHAALTGSPNSTINGTVQANPSPAPSDGLSLPSLIRSNSNPSPASSDSRPLPPLIRSNSIPSPSTETSSPVLSESTNTLYARARQSSGSNSTIKNIANTASVTKPTTTPHPSPRRPWTSEEESALLAGLDRVGGPHWSAILALYGAGGSVSEVLKDRNQVQLKDKARNLKLWFLKSGREVPPSLKGVTGELKTKEGRATTAGGGASDYSAAQERKQSTSSSLSEGSSSGKRPSNTPSSQQAKRAAR